MIVGMMTAVLCYLFCTAYIGYRRMEQWKNSSLTEKGRITQYRFSFVWNIGSLAAVLVLAWAVPIELTDLGFRAVRFQTGQNILFIATLLICGVLTALFVYQMIALQCSSAYRKNMSEVMRQKREAGGLYEKAVDSLIPRSRKEKRWFTLTALAAGVCEEVVFRGFFLYLLGETFPAASPYLLAVMAGVLFGVAHFYQGIKGAIKTSLIGVLFGTLYLWMNSLLLCVLLHILFDVSSAFLYESEE